jgi:hypothetical protein
MKDKEKNGKDTVKIKFLLKIYYWKVMTNCILIAYLIQVNFNSLILIIRLIQNGNMVNENLLKGMLLNEIQKVY